MANGYQTIADALNQYYQHYQNDTQYGDIDWSETFGKIFRRKKKPSNNEVAFTSLDANGEPMSEEEMANYTQHKASIPRTTPNQVDTTMFSPDNPFQTEFNKINAGGFFVKKPTTRLYQEAEAWESQNGKNDIARQLSEMEVERRKLELEALKNPQPQTKDGYIVIDDNILNSIPTKYRGFYRPGMQVKTSELTDLIEDPTKASSDSNINLSRQYGDVVENGYRQYLANVAARNKIRAENGDPQQQPRTLRGWIIQPENIDKLKIYNQYTNNNLEPLPSPGSTQTPEQIAAKEKELAGRTETGKKLGYKKTSEYTENDWWKADKIVSNEGSYTQALIKAMQDPSVPDSVIRAMTDRYNRRTNKKYTPEQLFAKLNKQPSKGGVQLANR